MAADETDDRDETDAVSNGDSIWTAAAGAFTDWRDGKDNDGLNRLVRLLTPVLWQIVRAYGLTRQEAEDAVQSTWLAVLAGAESIDEPQAVCGWITVVARRTAWRVKRSHRPDNSPELAIADDHLAPQPDPAAEVILTDSNKRLWRCVEQLSPLCRRLLRVIAFDERPTYATLSDELHIPIGTIGPTRGRCLEKLRRLLGGEPSWRD